MKIISQGYASDAKEGEAYYQLNGISQWDWSTPNDVFKCYHNIGETLISETIIECVKQEGNYTTYRTLLKSEITPEILAALEEKGIKSNNL